MPDAVSNAKEITGIHEEVFCQIKSVMENVSTNIEHNLIHCVWKVTCEIFILFFQNITFQRYSMILIVQN